MDLELVLRTSALLALAAGLSRLLYRAAPASRHLVWHLAIVLALLAPLLMPLVPAVALPTVPRVAAALESSVSTPPSALSTTTNPLSALGSVGALGTVLVGCWFLFCWLLSGLSVARASRPASAEWLSEARQVAARIGFRGRVEVRETVRGGSPHIAGLFRSVVMMPPAASRWSSDERQAAFVHELAHMRRSDRRTQAVAQLACAVYWFNPLVWYAAAGLARERERACDGEVLRAGIRPSAYAALLLGLARQPSAWTPATALSMARPSAIEGRLLLILGDAVRPPRRSTRWLVCGTVATCATAILGAQPAVSLALPQVAMPTSSPAPTPMITPAAEMQLDNVATSTGITDVLIRALGDTSAQVRERAALGLALTPGPEVIDPLLIALKDRDSQVREKAAIGLAFRRDPRILDPMLTAMTDADGQVREKAAVALGASGDARATDALQRATTDPDPQVREKAVAGLVLLRSGK